MKVRIPREYERLPAAQKKRLDEYCRNVAFEASRKTVEHDGRIMLDLYIKMVCKTLHDLFGMGEKRLYLFLGHHMRLFREQAALVKNGTQVEYLDAEMAKIFRKSGFPTSFFEGILGPLETEAEE